jgi:inosine/xanthosine triphosphatase
MASAKRTLVAVGSTNPAKVKGTKLAFSHAFESRTLAVKAVKTIPFVGAQPLTLDETVEGAQERAMFALESARPDFGVGVEAGLVELGKGWPGHYLNIQVAAVVDSKGRLSFGCSSGFPIPGRFVKKLKQSRGELDRYTHELVGDKKVREEEGIVYHLSKKRLSRVQMTEQCVSMALMPWLNRKLYDFA